VIGGPVFFREILAHSRRTRTYVFQTVFLAILVVCLIPAWPAPGGGVSGAAIADRGKWMFEWGGYLQLLLLVLLAPAVTANAITEEKGGNTLDLLLLTGAGPFAIVWGKFFSRLYVLWFLQFLTVPLLLALLTLGGVAPTAVFMTLGILCSFSLFAAGLGVFLSTILPRTTGVLLTGYVLLAGLLGAPAVLQALKVLRPAGSSYSPISVQISPLHDLMYVAHPTWFMPTESVATMWWITPLWNLAAGFGLVLIAGWILPHSREVGRILSIRRALDAFDRATFLLLRPRQLISHLRGKKPDAEAGPQVEARPIGTMNAIYWKETNVNTIGRFKTWWRMNLVMLVGLLGSYLLFANLLQSIDFHKAVVSVLAAVIILLSTVIATTTVSREREDGTLDLLATTPLDCGTYVLGKVRGIGRNILFLVALPFVHVGIWIAGGVIDPVCFVYLLLGVPVAVVASIVQGIFVSLLFPTTLRAIVAGIVVLIVQSALPLVCCVPTFNLALMGYFMIDPAQGLAGASTQASATLAKLLAQLFSAGTHLGFVFVVYSLIRSDFDRYVGRAA
jgi:ABC-type transport system involved in multi-copper enzyme maturation permease subunit